VFAKDEQGGPAMSDEELRSQVLTLFLAGHETTATALTWTFTLLSQHPESERKLHEELVAAIGDRLPTVDDLPQMSYGQQVIDESLRIYPPIPMIARMALGDDTLGGYHIPAGTMVVLSPEVTHRHPDYWDNPEGFDPERFEPEAVKARPHFAYFPFGGGPRKCIGDNFATLEMRLALPTIVQRVRLELLPGHKVQPAEGLTQRPEGVIAMTVHPR
ncbi:MAG TPA: cytochrome P450, partial [Anaerolineae bacterium]|nr:cytochrome P450 [Anaerolineae bacterium]